jgi:nicotinate-nucleotide adenylyltransferase
MQQSSQKPMRTGFFGGSFNPIHNGHIALAEQIMQHAGLDEVWFFVSPLNPFKRHATDLLDDTERLRLVDKALEGHPRLLATDYEFHLPKPSYTWKTLQSLSRDYPDRQFVLIIGADNWLAFNRWAHSDDIVNHYELAVYPREGFTIDVASLPPLVHLYNTELFPLSSTDIRQRVAEGKDISQMVPANIVDDVRRLYSSQCGR